MLAALAVGLACTACSPFATTAKPAVQPAPTESATPAGPASPASPAAAAAKASHRREVRQRFLAGVNGYCRAYYVMQKAANVRYPTTSGDHPRSLFMLAGTRRLLARLDGLRAPSSLSRAEFRGFARNEARLVHALREDASSNPGIVSAGDAAYNQVLANRHVFATNLGAKECDGLLPRAQARAATAATRHFIVTTDPHQACVALVTPQYLTSSEFGLSADPMAACYEEYRLEQAGSRPVAHDIDVQEVTGVEGLQATVTFTEVPDCGCGTLTAKLYLEHGRWLVSEVYEADRAA